MVCRFSCKPGFFIQLHGKSGSAFLPMSLKLVLIPLLLSPGEFPDLLWFTGERSSEEHCVPKAAGGVCGCWACPGHLGDHGAALGFGEGLAESSMCSSLQDMLGM